MSEFAYFNFKNYKYATTIDLFHGYFTPYYNEILNTTETNGIYLVKNRTYLSIYTNEDEQMFLNADMSKFSRELGHLTSSVFLDKSQVNYKYVNNFHTSFANCYSLYGSPVTSKKMTTMYGSYYNCQNLTGSPKANANVVNLIGTYYNCVNLDGSPITNDKVTVMKGTYYNCCNLTGSPVIGPNVISIEDCYYNCWALEGAPADCNKVLVAINAYYNCPNIYGTFNWYEPDYNIAKKINATNMFYNRNYANPLHIQVRENSSVFNALINHSDTYGNIYGVGEIEWVNIAGVYFNGLYNTYVTILQE